MTRVTRVTLDDPAHPDGKVRLGAVTTSRQPFDLEPAELAQHVFLPGSSGSGKTTTIARLSQGELHLGGAVILIDCKGGDLINTARDLATAEDVPFTCVDPDTEASLGYNACTGTPAEVANKLLGAFEYGPGSEVFKLAAAQAIPPAVRALAATGQPVTLDTLSETFKPGGLSRLGRDAGEPHDTLLRDIEGNRKGGGLAEAAYVGLQYRLGALMQGHFAETFRRTPALDWDTVLSERGVAYLGLSATAASEDVELFGRVICQDLKQACSRRLKLGTELRLKLGTELRPSLVIFDEFAALREAEQIVDLLLQARQARMQVVISTQYLPELVPVRSACLSAGLVIAHRIGGGKDDVEAVAAAFGTRSKLEQTLQIDRTTGQSDKGSLRRVDVYRVHPNTLRELPIGRAAVYSVNTSRIALVDVARA